MDHHKSKAILPSKALKQAHTIITDTFVLVQNGITNDPLVFQTFVSELLSVMDEIRVLHQDHGSTNILNPFNIMAHRRCLNHAIKLRARVRTHVAAAAMNKRHHEISAPIMQISWDTALGILEFADASDAGSSSSQRRLSSDLPAYEESLTVGLTLGPSECGDDVPGLIGALLDTMPRHSVNGDQQQIVVGRRDENGMVVVQFPSADRALAFENHWNAQPPPGYEDVPAFLQAVPVPEYSETPVY
ncbi:hypothetical protein C8R44DRAFT_815247, partial [Mycena epipterygia]